MERRDGRNLSPEVLQIIRRKAVECVVSGELTQQCAAEVFGMTRTTISRWVRAFHEEGSTALDNRRRGRPHGSLIGEERQTALLEVLARGLPERSHMAFPLWSRQAVAQLIEKRYGLALSRWTLQRLLHQWGLQLPPQGKTFFDGLSHGAARIAGRDGQAELSVREPRMAAWYLCRLSSSSHHPVWLAAFARRGEVVFCGEDSLPAAVPSLVLLLQGVQLLSRHYPLCQLACDAHMTREERDMIRRWLEQHWSQSLFCDLS